MPGALDGYSSSIVYKPTSLRYIFLYQVWLFIRPKLSRTYSESCCFAHSTLSSMPSWDLCKMCGRPRQECFSWSILHAWIFWGTLLPPPPCPITFLKVRPCLFLNQVNKIVYSLLVELLRSLMYFNNTNGPRMEPCGTPQVTFFSVDLLLYLPICFLLER